MLRFDVLHASWHADGEAFSGGEHEIAKPTKKLVKLASAAHAAGAIEVSEGLDLSHVQSQADGEAAYARAQESGKWHEGNLIQHELDKAAREELAAQDGDA